MEKTELWRRPFITLAAMGLLFCGNGWSQGRTARMLDAARQELRAAKLSEKEIEMRLKIVKSL